MAEYKDKKVITSLVLYAIEGGVRNVLCWLATILLLEPFVSLQTLILFPTSASRLCTLLGKVNSPSIVSVEGDVCGLLA